MNSAIYNLFSTKSFSVVLLAFALTIGNSSAQDSPQSLSSQFFELRDNSESYNEYKVIKSYSLNEFWNTVEDSLSGYRSQINLANKEIASLKTRIDKLNQDLNSIQETLEKSEARNDKIAFLGIFVNKSLYNIIVWGIIAGLGFLAGMLFISFKNNFKVTKKARKDFDDLVIEFEEYRRISREKQMKMGRELQTERNRTEELSEKIEKTKAHSR